MTIYDSPTEPTQSRDKNKDNDENDVLFSGW